MTFFFSSSAEAEPDSASAEARPGLLRVGTSGDYAPFSSLDGGGKRGGFDVAVAQAYAESRGWRIEWVPFRWPNLAADLAAGRFDIAMSGVTIRPERSAIGRFSLPVAESGAVVLVTAAGGLDLDALSASRPRIAVNAGGHLERVTRARFPRAKVTAVPENEHVLDMLQLGGCDAVVTDTREARTWLERWASAGGEPLRTLGPFTRDRKAYWWAVDDPARIRDLDLWLMERERSGDLARMRQAAFGPGPSARTADPWPALVAAIDERMALMPWVAAAKRRSGSPIAVPEVEARVVAAGRSAVWSEALAARLHSEGRPAPLGDATAAVYRELIEAAKALQRATPDSVPAELDLASEIRPALLRIGEKLAFLLVRLPGPATPDDVDAMERSLREGTALSSIGPEYARSLAEALHTFAEVSKASR